MYLLGRGNKKLSYIIFTQNGRYSGWIKQQNKPISYEQGCSSYSILDYPIVAYYHISRRYSKTAFHRSSLLMPKTTVFINMNLTVQQHITSLMDSDLGVITSPSWGIPSSSHWRHLWGRPCPLCDWHQDAAERSAGPTFHVALQRRGIRKPSCILTWTDGAQQASSTMDSMCWTSVPTHLTRSCCEDRHGFFHGSVRWGGGEGNLGGGEGEKL